MLIRIIRSGIWFSEMWNMKYLRKCFWNETFSFGTFYHQLAYRTLLQRHIQFGSFKRFARTQLNTFCWPIKNFLEHFCNIANETSDSSSFADDLIGILSFFRFVVFHRSSLFFVAWRQNPTETAVDEHLYANAAAAAAAMYNSIAML